MQQSASPQISELTVAGFRGRMARVGGSTNRRIRDQKQPKLRKRGCDPSPSRPAIQPSKPQSQLSRYLTSNNPPTINGPSWYVAALCITTGSESTQLEDESGKKVSSRDALWVVSASRGRTSPRRRDLQLMI